MLTFPVAFTNALAAQVASFTYCWVVTKTNGAVLRGTSHDRDIVITTGTYTGTYRANMAITSSDARSSSDGAIQNLEIDGAFQVDAQIPDLTVADVEAGLYDQASAVLLLVAWSDPNAGQKVVVSGTLGEFYRDSDGRYRTEVRGLTQLLDQQILRTYSSRCDVRVFGDERCKFNVAAVTRTGTVSAVTNRKTFIVELDAGPAPIGDNYYAGGRLLFTSGDNDNFMREVLSAEFDTSDVANIVLWEETPADIQIGDTISLPPGCDRTHLTCRDVHNNLVNFRGYGLFAVGKDRLIKGVV